MQRSDIFSVVFLCIINVIFMVVGIFLNSVVIISLWRSSQLRKKPCYFMILVLSCFDLAVVTISHPLLIVSTIYFSQGEIDKINTRGRKDQYRLCSMFLFVVCTFYAKCWTIPSPDASIFPSSISHKNKTSMFSGILHGYNNRYIAIGIFGFGNNSRYFCVCIYFIPSIPVHLFKLHNFYNRDVKTRGRKGCPNYSDGWK
jgi:hypothetical protein